MFNYQEIRQAVVDFIVIVNSHLERIDYIMTTDKIKRMLDACYLAKRIRELLPELPDGVTPAYIQYMDVIHTLQSGDSDVKVKVSYISDMLKLPRPGVTRTVKEILQVTLCL